MVAVAWIALCVALLAFELHHRALYALFIAIGAAAGALVAVFLPSAVPLQVAVATVTAAVGVAVVRPKVSHVIDHHHGGTVAVGVHGGLVGTVGVTLDRVGDEAANGHVLLAGERWLATSGGDGEIAAGTSVVVTAVARTRLVVWPADGHVLSHPGTDINTATDTAIDTDVGDP